jgi:hypothetical protein
MKSGKENGIGWAVNIEVTPNLFGETETGAKKIVEQITKKLAGIQEPEFLTPKEVEAIFKISTAQQAVYRNRETNRLECHQEAAGGLVLYKKEKVLEFIERMKKV